MKTLLALIVLSLALSACTTAGKKKQSTPHDFGGDRVELGK